MAFEICRSDWAVRPHGSSDKKDKENCNERAIHRKNL